MSRSVNLSKCKFFKVRVSFLKPFEKDFLLGIDKKSKLSDDEIWALAVDEVLANNLQPINFETIEGKAYNHDVKGISPYNASEVLESAHQLTLTLKATTATITEQRKAERDKKATETAETVAEFKAKETPKE